jgi:hypothetical protein
MFLPPTLMPLNNVKYLSNAISSQSFYEVLKLQTNMMHELFHSKAGYVF